MEIVFRKGVIEQDIAKVETHIEEANKVTKATASKLMRVLDKCEEKLESSIYPLYTKLLDIDSTKRDKYAEERRQSVKSLQGRMSQTRIRLAELEAPKPTACSLNSSKSWD